MNEFETWMTSAIAYARLRTKSADVSWLIGDETTMREYFEEELDPLTKKLGQNISSLDSQN